jgi:uncharacterized lipoprotein YajG
MKIQDFKLFSLGIILLLFSYIPFSYVNHAEKFELNNLNKIKGTIRSVKESKINSAKNGWLLKLENVDFTIRIDGDYYDVVNQNNFKNLIKPKAKIEVYTLKPELYGILKKINFNNGIKDAVIITCSNIEVLSLGDIQEKMSNLFVLNSILGFISLGLGTLFVLLSFKTEKE